MRYDHSSTSRIGQALSLLWSSPSILMTHALWKFTLFHIQFNFNVSPHEEHYYSHLYYIQSSAKINLIFLKGQRKFTFGFNRIELFHDALTKYHALTCGSALLPFFMQF
jgi:hypothetical protein